MKKGFLSLGIIVFGIIASLFILAKTPKNKTPENLYEASFYQQLENGKVQCQLCPNRCILSPGQRGLCKVRENIDGKLYSLVYGKPVTTAIDPIEKKPFYHFLPSAKTYSLATAGCNLACKYCQN
jgi:pyruvate formate lyase activating enzyme